MSYKLYKRKKRIKGTVKYTKKKPYVFNPAYRKNDNIIDVSKLSVYNDFMINNILTKKYIRRYKNLLKMVYLLFNDAFPGDVGFQAVLGEIDKLKALINDKYHKYLELEKERLFLKELDYIESEVNKKFLEQIILRDSFTHKTDFIR